MAAAETLAKKTGILPACKGLGISRSTFYDRKKRKEKGESKTRPKPARTLSEQERQRVLNELNSPRFMDKSPAEVWASLLDEGHYHCSERTMYRILKDNKEVKERRNQLTHPQYKKPELLATRPNQVWSWDITKLRGPVKWTYYYLYVILDIFSRYVVGWMVARNEAALLAQKLIRESCRKQAINPKQLTIHADRGSPMIARTTAQLFITLGINKSHSRPHVSDDNPYSESQFKTLKYRPDFPDRFGCIEDALTFCRSFFAWYNTEHHHSGIGMLTPEVVHYGLAEEVIKSRKVVLEEAYRRHPERFVRGVPLPPVLPEEVWINPPKKQPIEHRRNLQ